jgi:cell volume regulation protein A
VDEISEFGKIVLTVCAGASLALLARTITQHIAIPAAAVFLVAAAAVSDLSTAARDALSILDVERIAVVALVIILFDGGMNIGVRRFRAAAVPIALLGTLGTFGTAALVAGGAHYLLGFSWTTAGLLGAALAPTDPAVVFSVLGNRELGGRTGTILEGESGANDPVGIALMIGMIEFATSDHATFWTVIEEFAVEMVVGTAFGLAGGALMLLSMRRVWLADLQLYPLRFLAGAGLIYGATALAHGSGFLAVFVAGIVVGDARAPRKEEIEDFHASLASVAEVTVFIALGLTIDLGFLFDHGIWLDGIVLAVLLALVARPLAVGLLLLPVQLRWGERAFVMWSGLKGAVPILLAALAVIGGAPDADRLYGIVFVVVLLSVLVQGTSVPWAAQRLGVPMRLRTAAPPAD